MSTLIHCHSWEKAEKMVHISWAVKNIYVEYFYTVLCSYQMCCTWITCVGAAWQIQATFFPYKHIRYIPCLVAFLFLFLTINMATRHLHHTVCPSSFRLGSQSSPWCWDRRCACLGHSWQKQTSPRRRTHQWSEGRERIQPDWTVAGRPPLTLIHTTSWGGHNTSMWFSF